MAPGLPATDLGPWANPMAGNPLSTRAEVQQAVLDLVDPVVRNLSPGGARARLGTFGAVFPARVAELEGWARPLWGIVPLVAGGGRFDHWDRWRDGLVNGTDPDHEEYWGPCTTDVDQRMVEMAAIGVGLAFTPEHLWDPLPAAAKERVIEWLRGVERHEPAPNNWQFFRLLVQAGLERVGVDVDDDARERSLEQLESFALGDGWYVDGFTGNVDHYVPFAFHTYGLLLAASGLGDRAHAARWVERAHRFAPDVRTWFAADGAAVPYGRSQTYRFAQGSFWGALALADEEALPWGEVKGLALRHLRWWAQRPISDRDGVLSVGYGYDNRRMSESYNSAGSPYWCMKAFLALAAPEDHPFWTSDEVAPEPAGPPVTLDPPSMVVARDQHQVVAFFGRTGPDRTMFEQSAAKYRKFAYSSRYGFSGDLEPVFGETTTDSMLAVTDPAIEVRRVRTGIDRAEVDDGLVLTRWSPFADVVVDTLVAAGAPWHVRIHRIDTGRPLRVTETGFALPWDPQGFASGPPADDERDVARAVAASEAGASVAVGRIGWSRRGQVRALPVNANLMFPHTIVPALTASVEPGVHLFAAALGASERPGAVDPATAPDATTELLDRLDRFVEGAG
ncbi:MAG: DUF2264 domain-containing protein [Actinobacteria bacterium]|nr:DUF2264 domain-containing protein [Actinomycetota bacterium]